MKLLYILSIAIIGILLPATALAEIEEFDRGTNGLPRVTIKQGVVVGIVKVSGGGREFDSFEGIPYAEPPVGRNRFKEPKPSKPWKGIFKAFQPGNHCMQFEHGQTYPYQVIGEEDCLFINVYRPKDAFPGKNLPVIVNIHGGAFMFGFGELSTPRHLLDRDLVYINFNYRLGPLGFLSTDDDVVPGNNGLKDQSLALKWIKKNVYEFGGDSNSITLIGLSAGGASVHYHYLSPLSKGLFARGISFSGTALVPWALAENVFEKTQQLAASLGCPTSDSKDLLNCLQDKSAESIVATMNLFQPFLYNPFSPFGPVIEKEGANPFLPDHPLELMKCKKVQDIPWIATIADCEGLYPASEFVRSPAYLEELEADWSKYAPHVLDYNYTIPLSQQVSVSKTIKRHYLGHKEISLETFPELVQMIGDRLFVVPIEQSARLQASITRSPVYFYKFLYRGQHSISDFYSGGTENFGVSHADDNIYLYSGFASAEDSADDIKMTKLLVDFLEKYSKNGVTEVGNIKWKSLVPNAKHMNYLEILSPDVYRMTSSPGLGHRRFWESIPFEENENLFTTRKDEL